MHPVVFCVIDVRVSAMSNIRQLLSKKNCWLVLMCVIFYSIAQNSVTFPTIFNQHNINQSIHLCSQCFGIERLTVVVDCKVKALKKKKKSSGLSLSSDGLMSLFSPTAHWPTSALQQLLSLSQQQENLFLYLEIVLQQARVET